MLIAAFKVEIGPRALMVGRARQCGPAPAFEHESMGAARIKPHVENVGDAFVVLGLVIRAEIFLRAGL